MDVTPLIQSDQQVIQSYAGGKFRVSGQPYSDPIIVTPSETFAWNLQAKDVSGLTLEDFQALLDQSEQIDVVLLGCGPEIAFLDTALKQNLSEQGLSVDVMDTGAACRTYNVLMAEGRRVAAALFLS